MNGYKQGVKWVQQGAINSRGQFHGNSWQKPVKQGVFHNILPFSQGSRPSYDTTWEEAVGDAP